MSALDNPGEPYTPHRKGLHSDDRPYPGEEMCYCDQPKADSPVSDLVSKGGADSEGVTNPPKPYFVDPDITEVTNQHIDEMFDDPSPTPNIRELTEQLILLFYGIEALQEYRADNKLIPVTVHQAVALITKTVLEASHEAVKANNQLHKQHERNIDEAILEARLEEVKSFDTGRHFAMGYQESLDELDEYKQERIKKLYAEWERIKTLRGRL